MFTYNLHPIDNYSLFICSRKNTYSMTQENVRNKMQEGFAKIHPKVVEMTNIIMDAYQEGFNTCFLLLTGQKWEN